MSFKLTASDIASCQKKNSSLLGAGERIKMDGAVVQLLKVKVACKSSMRLQRETIIILHSTGDVFNSE